MDDVNGKKWSLQIIISYFIIIILLGAIVIIVDPYFHYHAPLKGFSYSLKKEEYINNGISRNFEFSAMITGTSVTKGFKTEEAGRIFGQNFVKTVYPGEGFKIINDNLKTAIDSNPGLRLVIRGLDTMWLMTDEDYKGYDEYPDYLYDDIIWNDTNYLYNREILINDVIPEIISSLKKIPADQFDDYGWGGEVGKENMLNEYKRPQKEEKVIEESETTEIFSAMERNLEKNVISTIRNNPNIEFYIFFPPYSICWWDSLNQLGIGTLKRRIDMERYAIEKLIVFDNVKLFSFFNNFDLICDLNNYTDEVHYTEEVCSKILGWIKEGRYQLNNDNYLDYLKEITEFYCNYDYDSIFN